MKTVLFSNVTTGETIKRTYDSNDSFVDTIIACKPVMQEESLTPCQARARAQWQERKMQAFMDYRAKRAKPVRYGKKALQAIDYLLGDKYRDKRTLNEKRQDKEWAELLANGTHEERIAYLDNARAKLVKQILGDSETVQAMREWLASPHCSVDAKCERAPYAELMRSVNS